MSIQRLTRYNCMVCQDSLEVENAPVARFTLPDGWGGAELIVFDDYEEHIILKLDVICPKCLKHLEIQLSELVQSGGN